MEGIVIKFRQRFLDHDIMVWKLPDGKRHVEIRGKRNIVNPRSCHTEAEAMWVAHLLAQLYLEDGRMCSSLEAPAWVQENEISEDTVGCQSCRKS